MAAVFGQLPCFFCTDILILLTIPQNASTEHERGILLFARFFKKEIKLV